MGEADTKSPRIRLDDLAEAVGIYLSCEAGDAGLLIRFDWGQVVICLAEDEEEKLVERLRRVKPGAKIGIIMVTDGPKKRVLVRYGQAGKYLKKQQTEAITMEGK